MTIRKKMILIVLACTIIPMCFVGMLGYFHARKTLEAVRMEKLKSIADLKVKRIEDFFADQKKHIMVAQQRPTLKKYTAMLADFSGDFSSPIYETIRNELDRALTIYEPVYGFINVFVANPEGRIIYVLDRSSARKLLGQTIPDLWGKSFADGQNGIRLSDIFASKIGTGRFSMVFLATIRSDDGQFVGVAAFETDMTPIYELIQNITGLGETGETLIAKKVGNRALFLNPLRHDPDAALKRSIDFGERQATDVQQALKNRNGCGLSVDYRSQKVLAAWRYIPSLDWGMVAKIDLAEAFEPITTLRDFVLVLVIAVIVLSIFAAFIVAKSLSDPIQALQQGVEEIGKGNFDHKIATNAKDEIGQLGRAFDKMTEQLKTVTASRDELDKEIKERKNVERELQKSMDEVGERIKELNCLFEISRLVERRGLTLKEILQGIVELIPPAWQYSDITCAKIVLEGQEFKTSNFKDTKWRLSQEIIVSGEPKGTLVVSYMQEIPESSEGPFLREERNLIDAISERLGKIVERSWAQEDLRKGEEKYRELMDNMHSGVAVYEVVDRGEDFVFKDFNRSGEKIEKIVRKNVIGRRVTEVFPGVKELGIFEVFQRVWRTGVPEYFSGGVYQDHRNPPSWRESYVYKLSSGEIVSVYQDVTEQKLAHKALEESEKRFRDLVENSLTGISIIKDGQIVYQNPKQERLLGPLPRPIKFKDTESIHPDDVAKVDAFYQSISAGKLPIGAMDFRFYPPGEKANLSNMKWIHCQASRIEYQGKDAMLVNIMDMTQAKVLEHLLTIQDKMASLGRVAAGIAHEIRNPLSGINIYLNTLKKLHHQDGSEEKVDQILSNLQSASIKIESVIRRVMDFAKPSEPKLTLIDINEPITDAINLTAVTMRKSGIKIEKFLKDDLPQSYADKNLIAEMVLNLLNNAAEAMKTMEAGKKIVVASFVQDDHIVMQVSDSGPGVPQEIRDKILDPYFTTKHEGTGIGLSLCLRIITDHGGSLTVLDSEFGGAEFRIEIPINPNKFSK